MGCRLAWRVTEFREGSHTARERRNFGSSRIRRGAKCKKPALAEAGSRLDVPEFLVHAGPGLATAEHAAKSATLDAKRVALQGDGGIIVAAGIGVVDTA